MIILSYHECNQTRMTTFIKAKLKKSENQMNIDKYSCKYIRISLYQINLPKNHHSKIDDDKGIISSKNVCKN